jgi:formylglycine-generating enzyme required for sulfatase activity
MFAMPGATRTPMTQQGSSMSKKSNGWIVAMVVALATAVLSAQSQPSRYRETLEGTLVSFEMVRVPGADGIADLYVGTTEVTWDLYDVFALGLDQTAPQPVGIDAIGKPSNPYGAPDYGWGHAGYPVISVTRQAADAFTKWLSLKTGREYRLPTDAEWTHVARLAARGISPADIAWHAGNAGMVTHAVGRKSPDALGLFDLFGNAGEWVMTSGETLVIRGGTYRSGPDTIGPTARAEQDYSWNERDPQLPKSQWWLSDGPHVGFRVVRPIRP